MKKRDFSFYLTHYLTVFLPGHRGVRTNTILSYRDTFIVFLKFCQEYKGIKIEKLTLDMFNYSLIQEFLTWLEVEKNCSVSTRNQRLTAIRSFFKYLQIESPEHLLLCQSIIAIEGKKRAKPIVSFLSRDGISLLLSQPNSSSWNERRDLVLLEVLYDTGARVTEICDLTVQDIRIEAPATAKLTGKLGKSRYVPLSAPVVDSLNIYLKERKLDSILSNNRPIFVNRSNQKLTRGGVSYILNKYVLRAQTSDSNHIPNTISPHCLRHSKAMHLLQSGVNLIYIRDFLGHEDVETTQIYAKADTEMKRNALVNTFIDETQPKIPSWIDDPDLMKNLLLIGK